MRLEIGAGERPHPDYDLHVDLLALPDIEVRCTIDRLPFGTGRWRAARNTSGAPEYEMISPTLREGPGCAAGRGWNRGPDALLVDGSGRGRRNREDNHWIIGGLREARTRRRRQGRALWMGKPPHEFDATRCAPRAELFGWTTSATST